MIGLAAICALASSCATNDQNNSVAAAASHQSAPTPSSEDELANLLETLRENSSDNELAISMHDALRLHLAKCYRSSADAPQPETRWASVRARLNPDGKLASLPRIVEHSGGSFGEAVATRARTAVIDCEPYYFLPAERYEGPTGWNEFTVTFDALGVR